MAVIEVQGSLKGESKTEAAVGLRISASAACHGMAAAAQDRMPPQEEIPPTERRVPEER